MQRPHLIEPNGFFFWRALFETYVKSKDIDLWQIIQSGDFYFEVEDKEMKLMKEKPYELLKDTKKNQLGKNEEAKMTFYNALPRKEYGRVFMCKTAKKILHTLIITHQGNSQVKNCKIDLLTQEYEKFLISSDETIDSAKVMTIEEAKDLATLPLSELIRNLKVYEMVLDNNGVGSKTTKEKVKTLALKAKVTREQTSDNSVTVHDKFDIYQVKAKGGKSSRCERECYNCDSKNHLSKDDNEPRNDATCLMAIDSQEEHSKLSSKVNELRLELKNLASNKEVIEPGKKCVELTQEVDSLKSNVSKLQNEIFNFSKFKKSSIALDDMLSCQKLPQDKEGLAFSKIDKTTSNLEKIKKSINDESWTVDMQEELDQFVRNNVWDLVPYPEGHTIIETKWVFRNKLVENGIVRISQKSQENSQKRANTDTRSRRVQNEAKDPKP
ncbi:hypothetical protein Tco_0333404 [Tanacetum coccineum]